MRGPMIWLAGMLICAAPSAAQAGAYADGFSQCLVRAAAPADRTLLVQWIFTSLSAHPALRGIATVDPARREGYTRNVAALIDRLALDRCPEQARLAHQREGVDPVRLGFETLLRLAAGDLMGNPATAAEVDGLAGFIDRRRWAELLGAPIAR